MALYAPVDGVVLTKSAEPGEVLAAGATVVTIGDLDHPWVRGYVRESDLGKVKLGQKVKVTTDSFPGKTYTGRVRSSRQRPNSRRSRSRPPRNG